MKEANNKQVYVNGPQEEVEEEAINIDDIDADSFPIDKFVNKSLEEGESIMGIAATLSKIMQRSRKFNMSDFDVDEIINLLISTRWRGTGGFIHKFARRIKRQKCNPEKMNIPTAGVLYDQNQDKFVMKYNPYFFLALLVISRASPDFHDERGVDWLGAVVLHELYHCMLRHVVDRGSFADDPDGNNTSRKEHMMWNIAHDMAINQHIEHIPSGCWIPGDPDNEVSKDMPLGKSSEAYYYMLKDVQDELEERGVFDEDGQPQGCPGQMDDHSGWSNEDEVSKSSMADSRLEADMKDAYSEAMRDKPNDMFGEGLEYIKEMVEKIVNRHSETPWEQILERFVSNAMTFNKRNTIKRINRYHPYTSPGHEKKYKARIAVSLDESGSVSNDMLEMLLNECFSIAEHAKFDLIPFTSKVAEDAIIEDINDANDFRNKWEGRKATGGTDFDAATEYVNQSRKYDAHIILTDLGAPSPKNSIIPRLWVAPEIVTNSGIHDPEQDDEMLITISGN